MRSLPEHSLDCWTAIVVRSAFPRATIWAPTQNALGNWDMAVGALGPYKAMLLENKGCEYRPATSRRAAGHDITIDVQQLRTWAGRSGPPVFYVLPTPRWRAQPPAATVLPLATQCALGTPPGSSCRNCRTTHPQGFGDWAHVIRADRLLAKLPVRPAAATFTRDSTYFALQAGALTLTNFLTEVAACRLVPQTPKAKEQVWEITENDPPPVIVDRAVKRKGRGGLLALHIPF